MDQRRTTLLIIYAQVIWLNVSRTLDLNVKSQAYTFELFC